MEVPPTSYREARFKTNERTESGASLRAVTSRPLAEGQLHLFPVYRELQVERRGADHGVLRDGSRDLRRLDIELAGDRSGAPQRGGLDESRDCTGCADGES